MNLNHLDFNKGDGLIPAVIQHHQSGKVLMLGYMNEEAAEKTEVTGRVTFYSRSKQRLWTKGETSGNFLELVDWQPDCDNDTLLILAKPHGPTCHTGADSCFFRKDFEGFDSESGQSTLVFLEELQKLLNSRKSELPEHSYTTRLFKEGTDKIAQKVGEEAVETVIASKNSDGRELIYEASDLVYHLMVLLTDRGFSIGEVIKELQKRHHT